jgi:hypothetical protein
MRFTVRTERLTTIAGYIAGFGLLFLIWHLAATGAGAGTRLDAD